MSKIRLAPHAAALALYGAVLFLVEFVRGAFLVSFLPVYAADHLGFSAAAIGLAVSVHYVSDTLVKCWAGYLLDRFPIRAIVAAGLAISLAGLLLISQAQSVGMLVVMSALFGIGMSPIWLVCLSKVKPERRAEHMGVLYTCWLAGLGLGPVALNFLIEHSYTFSYWLMVGLWAAATLLALLIGNAKSAPSGYIPIRRQVALLKDRLRTMKTLLPGMILQTTAAGMLVPVLPGFATGQLGLAYSEYSWVLLAGGACTVALLIPMGKLTDAWGKKGFIVGGFAVFALLLFALTRISSLAPAIAIAAGLGLSYAAVLPAWNALLARHVPEDQQNLGWGLFSSIEGVGVIAGPVLGGWIADRFHAGAAVLASSLLLAAIAVYYVRMPFGEKDAVRQPPES